MSIVVGIDVGKATLEVFMAGRSKRFVNSTTGFAELQQWSQGADLYVMEATGAYHRALADHLHEAGRGVAVVNPRMASYYSRSLGLAHKTDRADAKVLATYAECNSVPRYVPDPPTIRRVRQLVRHRERLVESRAAVRRQLAEPGLDAFESEQLRAQRQFLDAQLKAVEKEVREVVESDERLASSFALLLTIPGVGPVTALTILGEAGDLSRFPSAKHLASFAGVIPRIKESGTSVRGKATMTKSGSSALRKILSMSAMTAIRHEGPCQALSVRLLAKGHSPKSTLAAVMHKQLRIAYGVWTSQRAFSWPRTPLTTP